MAVSRARKDSQPYIAETYQQWTANLVDSYHEEALFKFGELALFTLMWRPVDFEQGRVDRCPDCFGGATARQAEAFSQPAMKECPACFGSTFQHGFRAQIIRPALFADRNVEMRDEARGTVQSDTIRVETTGEFRLRKGDYIFRFDNARYQVEEKNEDVMRDGFGSPVSRQSMAGSTSVHLEDPTTVAHRMPPAPSMLRSLLLKRGPFYIHDLRAEDRLSPGGYI